MLTIRKIFDTTFMSIEVIPVVIPVVVTAETDSNSESRKLFCSKKNNTKAVIKDNNKKRTTTYSDSLKAFFARSSFVFSP